MCSIQKRKQTMGFIEGVLTFAVNGQVVIEPLPAYVAELALVVEGFGPAVRHRVLSQHITSDTLHEIFSGRWLPWWGWPRYWSKGTPQSSSSGRAPRNCKLQRKYTSLIFQPWLGQRWTRLIHRQMLSPFLIFIASFLTAFSIRISWLCSLIFTTMSSIFFICATNAFS